jgi:hypothetical protein
MELNVNILSVTIENRGKFKQATVDYRDEAKGKADSKKVMSFGPGEKVFLYLATKPTGHHIVDNQKIGDYWNWVDIKPSTGSSDSSASPSASAATPSRAVPSGVSDDQRQRLIVRQNALTNSVAFNKGGEASLDDILMTADIMSRWVFNEYHPTAVRGKDMEDDIPF